MSDAVTQPDAAPESPSFRGRLDDLAEIIRAYNQVTENLQKSHESLQAEVVRLQEQLASADAQLQRSKRLAALGEMAAGIAHEIRNPLGAIQLYAGMVVEDLGKACSGGAEGARLDETTETARKIAAAVRGLDAIVNDVLSFARDLQPRIAAIPVDAIFGRAVEAHRAALAAANIELCCEESDLFVRADSDLIQQAMVNLIRNAIEAMSERHPEASAVLTLSARLENSLVVLSVRDTGPGISPEHIDRIFNPFFTTRNTGTGLGLAIVHRIVDAHGGTIGVHNDIRGGAVFELTLPAFAEPRRGEPGAVRPPNRLAGLLSPLAPRPASVASSGVGR